MSDFWAGAVLGVLVTGSVLGALLLWAGRRWRRQVRHARTTERLAHVGTLAGGVAHEIKNPLSTLSLQLEILEEEYAEADDPVGHRTLARVRSLMQEVERLREILEDFLSYARPHQLELQITDLNKLLGEVADFIRPDAMRQGVRVLELLDERMPPFALDPNKIKQALLNILLNAQEAMPDGGDIMVRSHLKGRTVTITVTDTGCGIAPEDTEKIFRVYYSSGKPGGSGLGLPTARRIVEDHGGRISVRSDVGKGTEFTIELPLVTRADALVEP
jgi:signal transduction histidine kinase